MALPPIPTIATAVRATYFLRNWSKHLALADTIGFDVPSGCSLRSPVMIHPMNGGVLPPTVYKQDQKSTVPDLLRYSSKDHALNK